MYSSLSQILDQTPQIPLRLINIRIKFLSQSDIIILTFPANFVLIPHHISEIKGIDIIIYLRQVPKVLL